MGKATAVLTTGTTTTAKLFVAALAFTGAYVGFSAYDTANSAPAPTQTLTLAAQAMPVTTQIAPTPGTVTVSTATAGTDCAKTFSAKSILINTAPGETLLYGWRLTRWNATTQQWRSYLADYAGFAGAQRTVNWEPRIVANPGWYRIELTVKGEKAIKSDRFQVSC